MMEKMKFKNFLLHSKTIRGTFDLPQDFSVQGISTDSRTLQRGEVFIALLGDYFDGHNFLEMAIRKGAAALVISKDQHLTGLPGKIPVIHTIDTLHFLMEYAGWYRSQFELPVIGLTGSTGKTTCKEMLAAVLNRKYQVVKTQKNLNNFIGVSLTLLQLQKNMEIAIVEMGTNHPGEISTLTEMVRPTQAAITNIGSGHIGFFGSREAIFDEKKALFDGMLPGSKIYLNMEDVLLRNYWRKDLTIHTYGLRGDYTYQATLVTVDQRGHVYFQINHGPEIRLAIPGRHQLLNALLAGSIGLDWEISPVEVKEALESVTSIDKRMEVIERHGITIINDAYNSNPESLRVAIDHLLDLSSPKNSRKFLVIGDMLELGEHSEEEHRRIGQYLQDKKIDYVFCLGPHSYQVVEILSQMKNSSIRSQFFTSHKELAGVLNTLLRRQDIMLLKGSRGMAMEKILDLLEIKG
jgi:UDP-N-acetylmuramoyl-tripeptide--D-alanyl-D-alanine ligase